MEFSQEDEVVEESLKEVERIWRERRVDEMKVKSELLGDANN